MRTLASGTMVGRHGLLTAPQPCPAHVTAGILILVTKNGTGVIPWQQRWQLVCVLFSGNVLCGHDCRHRRWFTINVFFCHHNSWAWSGSPANSTADTNNISSVGTGSTINAYTVSLTNNTGVTVNLTSSPWGNDSSFTNGEAKSDTRSSNSWSWSHPANTSVPTSGTLNMNIFNAPGIPVDADHMPLSKLQFRPGVNQEITSYSNEGGWRDCDKIRFRFGYPEKMGGWEKYTSSTYLGSARALHNWIALDGSNYLGIGTHLKYYIEEGQGMNDITPVRATTSAGDVTFAATDGSATITVSDTAHGAFENDFVTFSGAASLGGVITADVLNKEYQVVRVVDADSYEITSAVAANSSDSGNGGSSTVGTYQINTGLDTSVGGTGWGAGTYGRDGWGDAASSGLTTTNQIRLWSHDNFGEDLIINARDSNIYYWDKTNNLSTAAVELSTRTGTKTSIPQIAKQVLVSDQDRHVIAFGCDGLEH